MSEVDALAGFTRKNLKRWNDATVDQIDAALRHPATVYDRPSSTPTCLSSAEFLTLLWLVEGLIEALEECKMRDDSERIASLVDATFAAWRL